MKSKLLKSGKGSWHMILHKTDSHLARAIPAFEANAGVSRAVLTLILKDTERLHTQLKKSYVILLGDTK